MSLNPYFLISCGREAKKNDLPARFRFCTSKTDSGTGKSIIESQFQISTFSGNSNFAPSTSSAVNLPLIVSRWMEAEMYIFAIQAICAHSLLVSVIAVVP
jgi:hypothetical protein